ncbi:MAG: translocation/assembly module TamB [Deltaproteobacteria bacterium]|nr:translocation/assembly module TamB [Deltaproteobacteria bacterium]
MPRVRRGLYLSFLAVAIILGAILFTLQSHSFHRYVVSLFVRGRPVKVDFQRSRVNILTGRIVIDDLRVENPEKFLLTGDRFIFDLSYLSLVSGKIYISDVELQNPTVALFQKEKSSQTPKSPSEIVEQIFSHFEKSFLLQSIVFDRVFVTHLRLQKADAKEILIPEARLRIAPNLKREIEVDIRIGDIASVIPSLNSLDIELSLRRDLWKLRKLKLDGDKVQLTLRGELKGKMDKGAVKLEGECEVPKYLSETIHFSLESTLEKKKALIRNLNANLGKGVLTAEGEFDLAKLAYRLNFSAKEVAIESIFQKLASVVLSPAKGTAEVEGKAVGQLPKIFVDATAKIHQLEYGTSITAHEASGTLQLNWPNLDFNADVIGGTDGRRQGNVRGSVMFKKLVEGGKLQGMLKALDGRFEDASIADFLPHLKTSGRLSGDIHLEGEGTSAKGIAHALVTEAQTPAGVIHQLQTEVAIHPKGDVAFTKTTMTLPYFAEINWPGTIQLDVAEGVTVFNGQPAEGLAFKGNYQNKTNVFRIESLQFRRGESHLDGSLGLFSGEKIEARLKGIFNCEWLLAFPSLFREAKGLVRLDLEATGAVKQPVLRGQVEFLHNDLQFRNSPREFSNLSGTVQMDGATLTSKLKGVMDDGDFSLSGKMKLANWKPEEFNLAFQGSNLSLSRPNYYKVDFDADVTLKGQWPSPTLAGRVDVVDGRYFKDFVIRELVIRQEEPVLERSSLEKSIEKFNLDLAVKNSGDLKINNNVATILLRSDLQVDGTLGRPKVSGALTATEGLFHFLGRDFTLNEGRLEFIDPSRQEPYLVLQAQQEIPPQSPQYVVYVGVKGYLSNLDVALSSTPALQREDILSLIAYGMTKDEILQSGRSKQSLSSGILAGEISGVLQQPLARKTGLDIVRLEASQSGSLSRFSVGKNLTDRFSVEFQNDLAPATAETTLQGNYFLTDNILLKGFRTRTAGTENPSYQFDISFRLRLH